MASITTINKTGFVLNVTTNAAEINSSIRNCLNPGEFYVHSASPGTLYELRARYFTGASSIYESNWEKLAEIIVHAVMHLAQLGLAIVTAGASAPGWATAIGFSRGAAQVIQVSIKGIVTAAEKEAKKEVEKKIEEDIKELVLDDSKLAQKEFTISGVDGANDPVYEIMCKDGNNIEIRKTTNNSATATLMNMRIAGLQRSGFEQQRKNNAIYEFSAQGYPVTYNKATGKFQFIDSANRTVIVEDGRSAYFLDKGKQVPYDVESDYYPCPYPKTIEDSQITWETWATGSKDTDVNRTVWAPGGEQFNGIEIIVQPKYGVINARMIFDENCVTPWARSEMGGNAAYRRQFTFTGHLAGLSVAEKDGYGIVDVRVNWFDAQSGEINTSPWIARNEEVIKAGSDVAISRLKDLRIKFVSSSPFAPSRAAVGMKSIGDRQFGLVDIALAYMSRNNFEAQKRNFQ